MAKRSSKSKRVSKKSERSIFLREAESILLTKRRELSHSISSEIADMREGDNTDLTTSDVDDIGASQDNETTYKILELESAELEQIDAALERIEAGSYGVCEDCDKEIGIERLKALPFTNLCIACKRLQESSYDPNY